MGQGSLPIHPQKCLRKAVFLLNSRPSRLYATLKRVPLIENVRGNFAEFLKDNSAIALVYSTSPLESD